jgi:hypothetical protein
LRTIFAHCDAAGAIQYGEYVPKGSLPILRGDEDIVKKVVGGLCRKGYEGQEIVPGIPEAKDQNEALDAMFKFKEVVEQAAAKEGEVTR